MQSTNITNKKSQSSSKCSGFWTYRQSNDLIFVIDNNNKDTYANYVLENFGEFLKQEMTNKLTCELCEGRTPRKDRKLLQISPDWFQLVSIEVQTKKWNKSKSGSKPNLHVKFYFDKDYVKGSSLSDYFNEKTCENDFEKKAKYWNLEEQGSLEEVLNDKKDNKVTLIMEDSEFKQFIKNPTLSKLSKTKNLYIYSQKYADTIETKKSRN